MWYKPLANRARGPYRGAFAWGRGSTDRAQQGKCRNDWGPIFLSTSRANQKIHGLWSFTTRGNGTVQMKNPDKKRTWFTSRLPYQIIIHGIPRGSIAELFSYHAIENQALRKYVANKINATYPRPTIGGKVECNTVEITTIFLYSNWLYFYSIEWIVIWYAYF